METNSYMQYNLTDNPFPQNPTIIIDSQDKRMNGSIFYEGIFESEIKDLDRLLKSKTNVIYVRGTQMVRGDGKSAMIANAFRRYANNTNFITAFIRCTDSYGGVNDPSDFCREIILHLHYKKYLWQAFGRLLISFAHQSSKFNKISDRIELLIEKYPEPPEKLPITLFTKLSKSQELSEQFTNWLVREAGSQQITTKTLVDCYLDTPRKFDQILTKKSDKIKDYGDYLKILKRSGYKWCFFFLDQMEESIENTSKKDIGKFIIGFRRMIEEGTNYTSIICTLHYSSIKTLMDNPTAKINIAGFAPFDSNHFIGIYPQDLLKKRKFSEFISSYMNEFRKNKGVKDVDIMPFEQKIIEYIAFLYKGNLRDILRTMYNILEKSLVAGKGKIDIDFIVQNHSETIGKQFSQDEYDLFIRENIN